MTITVPNQSEPEAASARPRPAAAALPPLLAGYRPPPGCYDEVLDAGRSMRPRWQPVFEGLAEAGEGALGSVAETAEQLLYENSVTHLAHDGSADAARPWRLDVMPFVLDQAEWATLEKGLAQRARVLNATLADLYGPQRLLSEGVLPPAVVFANPEFLRPCHGIEVPGGVHLHFVAFDLARGPDGRWWVLSDRTQSPSGIGYALENRIIASRCVPDLFARANVQRVAGFFRSLSDSLLGQVRRDDPLAVVLAPSADGETYFEHAYLARYLGYTLVEGADLTVRDDRLYLKTVEGLKPVDLVFRRIGSRWCDPLELRSDSQMGVPGLAQVARHGRVVIANALGSGLVESDALMSFMQGLCRTLLDEDLLIPNIATWWCGEEPERAHVIKNMERLVMRRAFNDSTIFEPGLDSAIGPLMLGDERAELARRIREDGHDYVGQEMVSLSTAPYVDEAGGLAAAPLTLRVYLAATEDGYRMMPGGLARVTLDRHRVAPWLQPGDRMKDTWVRWDGPVERFSMLAPARRGPLLRRSDRGLPSRVADNMFWLGRYAERAEGATRLLRSMVERLGGERVGGADPVALDRLLTVLLSHAHVSSSQARRDPQERFRDLGSRLPFLVMGAEADDGLVPVLSNVLRTASLVRERLSVDTWRILNDLEAVPRRFSFRLGREVDDAHRLLDAVVDKLAALNGMVMENMTRGHGWRFLDIGRRVERAQRIARLVRDLAVREAAAPSGTLDLLLELADSTMTYRARYRVAPQLAAVLDLLLIDDSNPRSMMFQIAACETNMAALPIDGDRALADPTRRILIRLASDLRLADVERLAEADNIASRRALEVLLRRLVGGLGEFSDQVGRSYFVHSTTHRGAGPVHTEDPT
jgi:uncharacterized circularly permuted ATP-grasp superfamily protein/uncharacterized alpha-E superfamily protein